MTELRKEIWENGIHYTLIGDYYFPDVRSPEDCEPLGKWADLHLAYMKENDHHAHVQLLIADRVASIRLPGLHAAPQQHGRQHHDRHQPAAKTIHGFRFQHGITPYSRRCSSPAPRCSHRPSRKAP